MVEGVSGMSDIGPVAKWQNEDGYLTYFLHYSDEGYNLYKRDLNARISTTRKQVKAFSIEDAIKSVEAKIKPTENELARVY
jgi:hypothetical protein